MKQLCYYILAIAMIFGLCFLIVRSQRPQTELPTETGGATDPGTPVTGTPEAPVSGSDLYLPEPFSEAAQVALDALSDALRTDDRLCAVAYLGTVPAETSLAEHLERSGMLTALAEAHGAYAFLPELTPANCASGGFSRLYCLVLLPESAALRIWAGETELYQGEAGAAVLFTAPDSGFRLSLRTAAGEDRELSVTLQPDGTPAPQTGLLDFTE